MLATEEREETKKEQKDGLSRSKGGDEGVGGVEGDEEERGGGGWTE